MLSSFSPVRLYQYRPCWSQVSIIFASVSVSWVFAALGKISPCCMAVSMNFSRAAVAVYPFWEANCLNAL